MKKIMLVLSLLVFVLGCGHTTTMNKDFYDPIDVPVDKIHWQQYSKTKFEIAKFEKKPVFLLFTADRCKYCLKFKKKTLSDPFIQYMLNTYFINLKVDMIDENFYDIALGDFHIKGVPTVYIFSVDDLNYGYELSYTRLSGFVGPEILKIFLKSTTFNLASDDDYDY